MIKCILSLGLALVITACATPRPTQQSAVTASRGQPQMVVSRGTQAADQKLICSDNYPMGSHILQRICLTQDQEAARQKAAQEALQNLQAGQPKACTGGGGLLRVQFCRC